MTKKALCVGINNYPFGADNDLKGCVNDANNWAGLLKNNFEFDKVKRLLDGDATKAKILTELKDLLQGAKAGDTLVFTNASHGTYVADTNGDEPNFDEAICPHDMDSNVLIDDELRELFENIPSKVKFTVISDSCYSGSVTRLVPGHYQRSRQLPPSVWGGRTLSEDQMKKALRSKAKEQFPESKMKEILLSGCKSNQTSADAYIDNDYYGAMSYHAVKAIRDANYKLTYGQLHKRLLGLLEEGMYDQIPQLEGKEANKKEQIFS
jgi:metacaspase-1